MKGVIRYFEKLNEELAGEEFILDIDIDVVSKTFDLPARDPVHDVYEISSENVFQFSPYTSMKFEFSLHDYFFENEDK